MKKAIGILLLSIFLISADSSSVYVCNGGSSVRYHKISDCRGLSRCSTEIVRISTKDAIDMGRTPCQICY